MKTLIIYIHDFNLTVGHSRALIELLRSSEEWENLEEIKVVCFTADDKDALFPDFAGKVNYQHVPFPKIKPVLLKIIFYHFYCFLHSFLGNKSKSLSLSLGVAYPGADIFYIQFVHEQWREGYFKFFNKSFFTKTYKKLLYFYLCFLERKFYKEGKKFITIANFMKDYLKQKFSIKKDDIYLIYSGINSDEFSFSDDSTNSYRIIKSESENFSDKFNPQKPTYLFVGAFERKGIVQSIDWVNTIIEEINFIVVGQPEMGSIKNFNFPQNTIYIPFSKNISHYYAISDYFIFPTIYEPFGLVLIEAFAMGCKILTNFNNVGASELLVDQEGVYFFDQTKLESKDFISKTNRNERLELIRKRMKHIQGHRWKEKSQSFYKAIASYKAFQ